MRTTLPAFSVLLASLFAPMQSPAQTPDLQGVARNLVQSALIKSGDKVLITGSVRDVALLEDVAIEALKVGADPVINIWSERLTRRSFDEVPASFDSLPHPFGMALTRMVDAQIAVDIGESDSLLAHVPPARIAARRRANQPMMDAVLARSAPFVNIGNGLYPTPQLARRLGMPLPQLTSAFWQAARIPASELRAKGQSLQARSAHAKRVAVTDPNGTNITFAIAPEHGFVSDGALTQEKIKAGAGGSFTYLPAGELITPTVPGTAEGRIVVDKLLMDGTLVRGLVLVFSGGRLTSMTAASGLQAVKRQYDEAGKGKDQLGYIDIGLNPAAKVPVGAGPTVWMAAGAVTLGIGSNQGFGGNNVSDFFLPVQLARATVNADGTPLVEKGQLK